ncbi:MAG: DsbA family protein [bacterium]
MTTHQDNSDMAEGPIIASKQSFIFGVTVGVAATAILTLILVGSGTLNAGSLNNDSSVSNIKPLNNKALAGLKASEKKDVKLTKADHIRGNKNAKVTIIEYSDMQCPYCARFHETMRQIMLAYPNDVNWTFRHFPLESIHPYAKKAAEAAECAGDQDKFWEYTDKLYDNQGSISESYLGQVATELNLNIDKFNSCLATNKFAAKIDADAASGRSLGVQGTPGSFINGLSVPGNLPFSSLEPIIKEALQ